MGGGQIVFRILFFLSVLTCYDLTAQGGRAIFSINGTPVDLNQSQNSVLLLNDVCKTYTLCFEYENWDDVPKSGTIKINLPDNIYGMIDIGDFTPTGQGYHLEFECSFNVDGTDDEAEEFSKAGCCITFQQTKRGSIFPITLLHPNLFYKLEITSPNSEMFSYNPSIQTNPSKFIGEMGGTILLSDYELLNPNFINDACDQNSDGGLVISGHLILDEDFCFRNLISGGGLGVVMREHAQVTINSGKDLLIENSDVYGCSELWTSIFLENGSTIEVEDSRIRDGMYAIELDFNFNQSLYTIASIKNSIFEDNYISVYSHNNYYNNGQSAALLFADNSRFERYSGVKPYSPFGFNGSVYPFSGFYLYDLVYCVAKGNPSTFHPTVFSNMHYGIISENSNVGIEYCNFNNMISDLNQLSHGTGILASGQTNNLTITNLAQTSFTNMKYGIDMQSGNLNVNNTHMHLIDQTGIRYQSATDKNMHIRNCNINTRFRGIQVAATSPLASSIDPSGIFDCIVNVDNIFSRQNAGGISISNTSNNGGSETYVVHNNEIEVKACRYGIESNNSVLLNIRDNVVHQKNVQSQGNGIRVNGGTGHIIGCNYVDRDASPNASSTQSGIWISSAGTSEVTCNEVFDNSRGIFIEQTNLLQDFKGNYMDDSNSDGLFMYSNAVISPQFHKGNRFRSKGSLLLYEAIHEGGQNEINFSKFTVNDQANSEYLPNWITPNASNSDWFLSNQLENGYQCGLQEFQEQGEGCENANMMRTEGNRNLAMELAMMGAWLSGLEGETQRYIGIQQLQEDITLYPAQQNGEDLSAWVKFAEDTEAGKIWKVNKDLAELGRLTIAKRQEIELLQDKLKTNQSALSDLITQCDTINNCKHLIEELLERIQSDYVSIKEIYEPLNFHRNQELNLYLNNFPITNEEAANLDVEIADYLWQYQTGQLKWDSKEFEGRISEIAQLCPALYGPAVYTARGLIYGMSSETTWNDDNCFSVSERSSRSSEELMSTDDFVSEFEFFPTIVSDNITIKGTGMIHIINIAGKLVFQKYINGTENIDFTSFQSGVYIVKYESDEKVIENRKFIKL